MECANPDAGDAVGNDDARQASAATECVSPDAGDAVANGDARQAAAVMECVIPDAGDAVGDSDARQASALIECARPDAGDAVGNRDARQASAVPECAFPDAGDAPSINTVWDYKCASGVYGIISNRHRYSVGIDLVGIQPKFTSRCFLSRHAAIASKISCRSVAIRYNRIT